jgi:hypothetical protein
MLDFVGLQLREAQQAGKRLKETADKRVQALQVLRSPVAGGTDLQVQSFVGAPGTLRSSKSSKDSTKEKAASGRAHKVVRTFQERVLYPAHGSRTKDFKKTRDQLIKVEKKGCLVCRVTEDSLTDPKQNPYGATQLEAHHRLVEHALAKAVDLKAFNDELRLKLRERHKGPDGKSDYDEPFTQAGLEAWIDHHRDNMWVLCDVHHRHKFVGIHAVTYPLWGPLDVLKPGTVG